jgi:hypothetical protein
MQVGITLDEVMVKHCRIRLGDNTARANWRRAVQIASYKVVAKPTKPVMAKLLAELAAEPMGKLEGELDVLTTSRRKQRKRPTPTSRTRSFTSTKADPDNSDSITVVI